MLNGASTVPASGGEPLLYVAELLHRVSNEYASAISLASVMASRASSPEVRSALETVIEHLVQLATAHRVLFPPRCQRNRRPWRLPDAALPSQSGGGTRAAGHRPPAPCCRVPRGTRAFALLARRTYRLRAHRRCGAPGLPSGHGEFSFRLLPTPARSSAGSATTARLRRPSGQASEHVSSMRLPWNSTVMLSDNSVTREQR